MSETEGKGGPPSEVNQGEATVEHVSSSPQQGGMSGTSPVATIHPTTTTTVTEDEDESEDESCILEESPCGRWQKRKEEVKDSMSVKEIRIYNVMLGYNGMVCFRLISVTFLGLMLRTLPWTQRRGWKWSGMKSCFQNGRTSNFWRCNTYIT